MSVRALITEGIGPGGSVLYALTGGLDIGSAPPPPAANDIRSAYLSISGGMMHLTGESGNLELETKGGTLSLRTDNGSLELETKGPPGAQLVITS